MPSNAHRMLLQSIDAMLRGQGGAGPSPNVAAAQPPQHPLMQALMAMSAKPDATNVARETPINTSREEKLYQLENGIAGDDEAAFLEGYPQAARRVDRIRARMDSMADIKSRPRNRPPLPLDYQPPVKLTEIKD